MNQEIKEALNLVVSLRTAPVHLGLLDDKVMVHIAPDQLELAAQMICDQQDLIITQRDLICAQRDLINDLQSQLSAIGAGGVEKLRKGADEAQRVTVDFKQATDLLEMFGGEPSSVTLGYGNGHNGNGLYASYTDMPEEGSHFLGETDSDASPQAQDVQTGSHFCPLNQLKLRLIACGAVSTFNGDPTILKKSAIDLVEQAITASAKGGAQ